MKLSIRHRMGSQDLHIIVNGATQTLMTYQRNGQGIFRCPARCFGQHNRWQQPMGDTRPGLYRVGQLYNTTGEAAYGEWCVDLEDLEGQETGNGRAGISLHGGGSGLANPFAPYQGWQATHGCIRLQNADLARLVEIIETAKNIGGTVYLTVYYPNGQLQ